MSADSELRNADAAVAEEDRARADFYALIARLFHAGPDASLLVAMAGAGDLAGEGGNAALAEAWKALRHAAGNVRAEAARDEYDLVFVGTGKAEVSPYVSSYLSERAKENLLLRLRSELQALGLARADGAAEYEDHFAALCEVMRHLIIFAQNGAVQKQKSLFLRYLEPCYAIVCDATAASPNTDFYKHVARFAKAFLDVESEAFELTP